RIRRCGGRSVPGGGTDDRPRTLLERFGHREEHPAILEGAGGVGALDLEEDLTAGARGERGGGDEGRGTLAQREARRRVGDGEPMPEAGHESEGHVSPPAGCAPAGWRGRGPGGWSRAL